jgi:hypothetical protein
MSVKAENCPEFLISLPRRGVRVIPPRQTMDNMRLAREGFSITPWSEGEKARLALIKKDPIMAKRYPDPNSGQALMAEVCYERREELLLLAKDLTGVIVSEWGKISSDKDIAVVLFGSVARGLVRSREHPDPSNIDMSIIGNFSEEERLMLLDAIRPARQEIRLKIIKTCVGQEFSGISGNAGVYVQNVDKLINNKFACAKEYISSNAFSLHDPSGIWKMVEESALNHEAGLIRARASRRPNVAGSRQIVFAPS